MQSGVEMGRGGSKKSKPILTPPYGAGLKSPPTLVPPPLRGWKNLCRAKRGGASQAGRGKIAIPISNNLFNRLYLSMWYCISLQTVFAR